MLYNVIILYILYIYIHTHKYYILLAFLKDFFCPYSSILSNSSVKKICSCSFSQMHPFVALSSVTILFCTDSTRHGSTVHSQLAHALLHADCQC